MNRHAKFPESLFLCTIIVAAFLTQGPIATATPPQPPSKPLSLASFSPVISEATLEMVVPGDRIEELVQQSFRGYTYKKLKLSLVVQDISLDFGEGYLIVRSLIELDGSVKTKLFDFPLKTDVTLTSKINLSVHNWKIDTAVNDTQSSETNPVIDIAVGVFKLDDVINDNLEKSLNAIFTPHKSLKDYANAHISQFVRSNGIRKFPAHSHLDIDAVPAGLQIKIAFDEDPT